MRTESSSFLRILLSLLLVWLASSAQAQETHPPLRVLLIGNSYTYYHDLGTKLLWLLESAGRPADVVTVADGGLQLQDHRRLGSLRTAPGPWDFVVLQGQSRMPIRYPRKMSMHAGALVSDVRDMGAEPVFFMTWPRAGSPENREPIASVYRRLAKAHGARLAPVGVAFGLVRQANEQLHDTLYDPDGSHPAPLGTWLTALTLCETLLGIDARRFSQIPDLDATTLRSLSEAAHQAVMETRGNAAQVPQPLQQPRSHD